MGYSNWSNDAYSRLSTDRTTKTTNEVFTNTSAIDKALNPKGVKFRESRDSKEHPNSNAVMVMFDVTGSMRELPAMFVKKLGNLMKLLIERGYIEDPQICFGAIGDANGDEAPLQVGQFESGLEMDQWLTKIFLEGRGGGASGSEYCHETYENGIYFAARHTSMDCWEKRKKKGYLFLVGDEMPYDVVRKSHVARFIGDKIEADIPTSEIVKEARKTFEVFHIFINAGSYSREDYRDIQKVWKDLLGERSLTLDDPQFVCELIGATIGVNEGSELDEVESDLKETGASAKSVKSVSQALVPYTGASGGKSGTVSGTLAPVDNKKGGKKIKRL